MDHFGDIDEAIKAVRDARKMLRQKTSKQVTSGDERDHMKTVAGIWFSRLRPRIARHVDDGAMAIVDEPLRRVLDATARASARTTYDLSLDAARKGLLALRKSMPTELAAMRVVRSDDSPPNFGPLATDPRMQEIMERRWQECAVCIESGAYLASVVMMGGLLESLFISKANHLHDKRVLVTAKRAPQRSNKTLPIQEWTLNHYIEVGHEIGWIGASAKSVSGVLRDYRNYIHPQAEYTKGKAVTEQDARVLWNVAKALVQEILM